MWDALASEPGLCSHSLPRVGVQSEDSQELARRELPPLDHVVNLFDFESLAKSVLNPQVKRDRVFVGREIL